MAKSIQMMKTNVFGTRYSVVFRKDVSVNPFYLYKHGHRYDKYGYLRETKTLVERYANFEGCLYHLLQSNEPEFRRDSNFPA